ncbi:DNA translocase FtsK 4TM domain-containing protein, partial [Deltaproteobacteria bacterium OttesenSCG-928-K17]|nr:DNA translocase FtsK 4TM domain-containing protein [Deltaproteobacteria bacterium OttesenSCG-928-K17]
MAKASTKVNRKKGRKKNGAAGFKIPRPAVWISLAALAGLILLALISYDQADPSVFGPARTGGQVNNGLGLAGAYAASFLVQSFGIGAIWPVPFFLAASWAVFKKTRPNLTHLYKLAGWSLLLFSVLAILAMTWPHHPWPAYGGGGRFGHFLARGALGFLGRFGASLALPILSVVGLFMAVNSLWPKCLEMYAEMKAARAERRLEIQNSRQAAAAKEADDHELGLDDDPLDVPEPVIVEKARPEPAEPAPAKKKPAPAPRENKQTYKEPDAPYELPAVDFLDLPPKGQGGHASGLPKEKLTENAHLLEAKLRDFGVDGRVLEVSGGPVITMYEYQPAPGIKISKVAGLADDLTMAMRAISIRVVAPLPGKAAIGIEIPNPKRRLVTFREVVESDDFQNSASPLTLVLGVDIMGAPVVADLAKMPHLLIAGATGSGKSVGLGSMIMSILYKARPDQVRFLMIDPKCVELALYKDIPHLIYPVLSDPSEATLGLKWAVAEMDMRYKLLAEKGVRNIETYNAKIREELKSWKAPKKRPDDEEGEAEPQPPQELPFLVIIIDELADLMMVAAKEVEVYI